MAIEQEIMEKARMFIRGELSDVKAEFLYEMCLSANYELLLRLKEEISVEVIHEQYIRAAGALAASLYLEMDNWAPERFTAGHVTVQRSKTEKTTSEILRRQAELMLTGYIKDSGFGFKAVRA